MAVMHQLTQLAGDLHRQRLTHADQQRPPSACSRWRGPPAAPSAPGGGCTAPPARTGGYAPSSEPRPGALVITQPPAARKTPAQQ